MDRKPNIIHAHFGQMGLNVLPAAISANLPIITTFHGNDASSLLENGRYKTSLKHLFEYENSYIIAISERIKKRLVDLGALPTRCFHHYIGTDVQHFSPRSDFNAGPLVKNERVDYLQISNFFAKKGQYFTILAFHQLALKYPQVYLTLAGDGPQRTECIALVKKLKMENRIIFSGRIDYTEVCNYLTKADVFIHNSITPPDKSEEGIPTVIMEAMATGLPILSTFHSGIPELIHNGVNGFLAEEKALDQYMDNMEKILFADLSSMREASRKIAVESFNIDIQNRKLERIYRFILNTHN